MTFIYIIAITAFIVALIEVVSRPMTHYNRAKKHFYALTKAIGLGYLVYHSNDKKYYYALTYKQAIVKIGCTYADAALFSNWSKEALSVVIRKSCVQFA